MTRRDAIRLAALLLAVGPFAARGQPAATESLVEPPLSADAEFARNLALIRADLLMADTLVKDRDWVDAQPHASFPHEEVYGVIRDELHRYRTPQFDGALRELVHAIGARSLKLYARAQTKITAALAAADAALKARQKDWPRFTITVAAATLRDAADEYDEAVTNGRIVHGLGYQTARSIVFESDRMIDAVGADLAGRQSDTVQQLRGSLMHLKDVFAPVYAPKELRADPDAVRSLVAQIDTLARAIR